MNTPTPTASQLAAVPSPASKKSGVHNVSTPGAHNLSSPAPRSVPSPATTRKDQAGKTPAGNTTGSTGSKTLGGTPMVPNLSQHSMASPLPGGLSAATPTGLGVDLGTPALGSAMGYSLSELGQLANGGVKRNEDEERRTKMRHILKTIGRARGRVGEEGIARLARRYGLANDIDAEKLTAEERERRTGNRTISIAGNTIVIDVDLKENTPRNVQVVFANDMANANGNPERAGQILLEDLTQGKTPTINSMLDRFAVNLERLARLDRLSTKVNCFDALSGIYASLKRLYDQEAKLASALEVTKRRSGRPALHEDKALGLAIKYHESSNAQHKIWIETARCPSAMYPSVRVSDTWLPETFEIPKDQPIPWQEPPPVSFGLETEDETGLPAGPDVRFMARLDPPIVLPWQVATNILAMVDSEMQPKFQDPYATYLGLLLGPLPATEYLMTKVKVQVPSGDSFTNVEHVYNISVAKNDAGYSLEEFPFSHPRQIIELLPVLRQWQTFNEMIVTQLDAKDPKQENEGPQDATEEVLSKARNGSDQNVECVITTILNPTLNLTFPLEDESLCTADMQVLPNGELHLGNELADVPNASKAFALCGDIGVWIEWVRSRKKGVTS